MRIPAWLVIIGVLAMAGMTLLCSVVTYSASYRVVIDLSNQGVCVSSIGDLVQALLRRDVSGNKCSSGGFSQPGVPQVTSTVIPTIVANAPTPLPGQTLEPTAAAEAAVAPAPTLDPAANYVLQDPRKINILLMGIDQRSQMDENSLIAHTDTIMVLSVDPVRKTAGLLSIPRDLWVPIPGSVPARINTAYAVGNTNGYPGGGAALLAETIQQNIGIDTSYYVLINFDVFLTLTNTLAPNGVEVCIPQTIDDPYYPDSYYGTIHVHFDAGCQMLDAEHLLEYARTRHGSEGSDFDRSRRQQEVLQLLKDKLLSVGGVTQFIAQAPSLWQQLSGSFKTNLSLEQIISLGYVMQGIASDHFHTGVIDNLYVSFATTNTGDQVLLPNPDAIRQLVTRVFSPEDDLTLADLRTRAESENASVVVYNNTDISGLAGQTQTWLISQGISVQTVGNIPTPTNSNTIIRTYTGKTWMARYIAALMGLSSDRVQLGGDGLTTADVMVVVGPDIQPLLSGGQ